MQEVLSRNSDSSELIDGEQFIELCLSDIGPDEHFPSFWVKEAIARWDAINKQIVWDDPKLYPFKTLDEAQKWYEERRRVLVEKGFKYSDMEL